MKNTVGIIAAFLGGAVVGAAIGILLAPESGEETRKKLLAELEKSGIRFPKSDDTGSMPEEPTPADTEVK